MDRQRLESALRDAFPTVAIRTPLAVLGEGFGSVVVETTDGVVFRIAKHAEAQRGQQRERYVLPIVQRAGGGLRVPEVEYFLETSPAFPYGVIGYEKLPGRALAPSDIDAGNRVRIAGQVALFLSALHGIGLGHLSDVDLPGFPHAPARLRELWQTVSAYLKRRVSGVEHQQMQGRLEALLGYWQRYSYVPTLVHGDCWYENMLFDEAEQRLVGIIDFENAAIGDAAIDLATQSYLGEQFAQEVIGAYYPEQIPVDLAARMRELLAVRELLGLEQGIRISDVDVNALEKVKQALLAAP